MMRLEACASRWVPEDDNGNLTMLDYKKGGSTVRSYGYSYDKNGMRTSMTDVDGTHNYTYDSLYQIVQATHPTAPNPLEQFSYDAAGNRLTDNIHSNYQYNELNQLTEDDSCKYVYDADGNQTEKIDKATGDTTHFVYDIENKLVQVQKAGMLAQYAYDALGRRMNKTVNGAVVQYRFSGENLILEMGKNDSTTASYTFGFGSDNPLSISRNGNNYFYVKDGLGSVTALTDDAGNVKHKYQYTVFGRIIDESGDTVENQFTYTSRELDKETGNYYYRVRYYDANIGKFLSVDPIHSVNLYSYVSNNPIMARDPHGLYEVVGYNGNDWGKTRVSLLDINAQCSERSNSSSGTCNTTDTKLYVLSGNVSVDATVQYIVGTVRNTSGTRECPRSAANIARTIAHENAHVATFVSQAQSYSSLLQGVFSSMNECNAAKQQRIANINNNWNSFLRQQQSCDPSGQSQMQESIDAGCE